jgi:hypothetical protein
MATQTPTSAQTTAAKAPATSSVPQVHREPDGPGKRVGVVGEFTMIAPVKPGGAARFRDQLARFQTEAFEYEPLLGTVHDLRILFFDNDTRMLFAATYDGDFLPYVADVFAKATPWLDGMFLDVIDGYPGGKDPGVKEWVLQHQIEADLWYASLETASIKDLTKGQKVLQAFDALLDTASS